MKKFTLLILILWTSSSQAMNGVLNLEKFLNDFKTDPRAGLEQIPPKKFKVNKRTSFDQKYSIREDLKFSPDKSIIRENDSPYVLLEGGYVELNVSKMEQMGLKKSEPLATAPWSDDYWPIFKGVLGNRYADTSFSEIYVWNKAYEYVQKHSLIDIYQTGVGSDLNKLSPSEKYDLLVGSTSGGLTKSMWMEGKRYFDNNGHVEQWMGICHGWAAASFVMERPLSKIEVQTFNGQNIIFYPSDIKALISLLWAKTTSNINFIGGRCNSKNPATDSNGRVIEADCLDTNPGTWHISVVNKLGIKKESFVFDATYDYEVWNQPVVAYEYEYFNPKNHSKNTTFEDGLIALEDYKDDPFAAYRSKNAKYIIGIHMKVKYLAETTPVQRNHDHPQYDAHNSVEYVYDLELDEKFNIIGGEWYQNAHPDFLWAPEKGARALSDGDFFIVGDDYWQGDRPISDQWIYAANVSSRSGQPLAMIVESLIKLSNKEKK